MVLAESLVGLPYRYGGDDVDGFDCSGLVHYVFDSYGIEVPRTARSQAKFKKKIKYSQAKPGDILVFKLTRHRWHTAIYAGADTFIHSPNRHATVRKEMVNTFWKKRLEKVIRVIEE